MSSVLRPVRKRKKGRTLGRVDIMRREDYAELELDAKVELIRSLVPLGLMQVEELLDAEVTALAGEHYARKAASIGGRRHGSNPGTVSLAGQRVPIRVPRVRSVAGSELPLRSYEALRGEGAVNALLLKRVPVRNLVPQLRGGRRGDSRRDRAVWIDGVPELHRGQRREAPRAPGAGTWRLRTWWPWCWTARRSPRRAGDHAFWGETLPRLCGDGHRERAGADAVLAVVSRAGPGPLPGRAGDPRRRQRAAVGRQEGLPPPRLGPTVPVAQARERGEPPGQARAGGVASAPPARL